MIKAVGTVSVFVREQERAKTFYTDVLGLEPRTDTPLYPGANSRWIAVAPAGETTEIILYLPDENWEHYWQTVGKSQAITLTVGNMAEAYAAITAMGVTFLQKPDVQPWGTFAMIQDSEGNSLLLVEQAGG